MPDTISLADVKLTPEEIERLLALLRIVPDIQAQYEYQTALALITSSWRKMVIGTAAVLVALGVIGTGLVWIADIVMRGIK